MNTPTVAESGSKILTLEQTVAAVRRRRETHPHEQTVAQALADPGSKLNATVASLGRQLRAERTSRRAGRAPRPASNGKTKGSKRTGSKRTTGSGSTSSGEDSDPPPTARACARAGCLHSLPPGSATQRRYCGRHDCNRERQNERQHASRVRGGRDRPLDYDLIPYERDLTRMWIAGDRELAEHLARELRDLTLGRIEDCPAREVPILARRSVFNDESCEDESPDLEAPEAEVVGIDELREHTSECPICGGEAHVLTGAPLDLWTCERCAPGRPFRLLELASCESERRAA